MMTRAARRAVLAATIAWAALAFAAAAQPHQVQTVLPQATLAGQGRLTFWGLHVYDASLWIQPGFKSAEYEGHAFALELHYLRDFTNEAIAQRSIEEMQRLRGASASQLAAWQVLLRDAIPDIKKGDRVVGMHRPGAGVVFFTNGQATGTIRDPDFGKMFFGIWLSTSTSEPRLREALLARVTMP